MQVKNNCWSKEIWGQTNFLIKNGFAPKKFGLKKFWVQKFFGPQTCGSRNIFAPKNLG